MIIQTLVGIEGMNFIKYQGIGLLELMLSLLVIAAILFTAVRFYPLAQENTRVTEAASMVNTIVDASYKWQEGTTPFPTDNSANFLQTLINSDLLSASFSVNPWQGSILIHGASDNSANDDRIAVEFDGLPLSSCNNLALKTQQTAVPASQLTPAQTTNPRCLPASGQQGLANYVGVF